MPWVSKEGSMPRRSVVRKLDPQIARMERLDAWVRMLAYETHAPARQG